jgi:olefin beta-lactone synthetase
MSLHRPAPAVTEPGGASVGAASDSAFEERWLSLVRGDNLPLNLADEFAVVAGRRPDAPAVILARHAEHGHEYESLTFRRSWEVSEQYARGLRALGVERGDTALVLMKPMLDLVPVFIALWKIGAVPLVMDPGAPREQKLRAVEEIGPKVLIGIPIAHLLRFLYPRTFRSISHAVVAGRAWFLPGRPTLESFLRAPSNGPSASAPSVADDTLAIAFTSGSTGAPKGVRYTQRSGAAVIQIMKDALGIGSGDVCLACHPAFAMYFVGMGASVIIPDLDPRVPARASPECLLDIIRARKPTVAFMQLPILRNLCRYCADHDEKIPYLGTILTTGASVSIDLVETVHRYLAEPEADLHVMYGATEALSICFATGREMLSVAGPRMRAWKGTYLGRPSVSVQARIVGITDQPIERWRPELVLPPGQIGEICVSGPVVTPEYRNRPEATRKAKIPATAGLWHRMGDAGYMDEEGGLWYCGRIADRVETPSGTLYSDLVEPIFNQHPGVKRSALIGLPQAHSSTKRPVLLVEPASADSSDPTEELKALAHRHPDTSAIEDILVYPGEFPVDVRHNAKIRRDQLVDYASRQLRGGAPEHTPARMIRFKGHRLSCHEKGQGDPLLFLHNAGNDHHVWDFQFEYFARKCRAVAVDSLGYGASDHPAIDYTLPLYTDMVAAVVESLSLAPVTIVATCTGAAMALNYTLEHPENVKRLILFHIATKNTAVGGNIVPQCWVLPGRPGLTRAVSAAVGAMLSRGLLQRAIVRGQYGIRVEQNSGFIDHLRGLYSSKGRVSCLFNLFSNWESFASLDRITYPGDFPPLHVFWGGSNRVLPAARGRELCERLRPSSFDLIQDGGHLVMREQPELINRRLDELVSAR